MCAPFIEIFCFSLLLRVDTYLCFCNSSCCRELLKGSRPAHSPSSSGALQGSSSKSDLSLTVVRFAVFCLCPLSSWPEGRRTIVACGSMKVGNLCANLRQRRQLTVFKLSLTASLSPHHIMSKRNWSRFCRFRATRSFWNSQPSSWETVPWKLRAGSVSVSLHLSTPT